MKALILNSGMGTRMEHLTVKQPKCLTELSPGESILSRQLEFLKRAGVNDIVITTGFLQEILEDYCHSLELGLQYNFVFNERYATTNYIYSIYLAMDFLDSDIILLHGDLVFDYGILQELLLDHRSLMTISTSLPLPEKDFKAVIEDEYIKKVGIEFFDQAVTAQPLYKLNQTDWLIWLESIACFCERGEVTCYAENAFNEVSDHCKIQPFDFGERLCLEIDNLADLERVKKTINMNRGVGH